MTEQNYRPSVGDLANTIRHRIINTPETADFMAGVPIEAAHPRASLPTSPDESRSAEGGTSR